MCAAFIRPSSMIYLSAGLRPNEQARGVAVLGVFDTLPAILSQVTWLTDCCCCCCCCCYALLLCIWHYYIKAPHLSRTQYNQLTCVVVCCCCCCCCCWWCWCCFVSCSFSRVNPAFLHGCLLRPKFSADQGFLLQRRAFPARHPDHWSWLTIR